MVYKHRDYICVHFPGDAFEVVVVIVVVYQKHAANNTVDKDRVREQKHRLCFLMYLFQFIRTKNIQCPGSPNENMHATHIMAYIPLNARDAYMDR